jgi:hypothetical protein
VVSRAEQSLKGYPVAKTHPEGLRVEGALFGAEAGILNTGYWGVESMTEESSFIGTSISSDLIERGQVVTCMLALG